MVLVTQAIPTAGAPYYADTSTDDLNSVPSTPLLATEEGGVLTISIEGEGGVEIDLATLQEDVQRTVTVYRQGAVLTLNPTDYYAAVITIPPRAVTELEAPPVGESGVPDEGGQTSPWLPLDTNGVSVILWP